MARYLLWRVALLALSTLVASVVIFGVLRVLPGDVAIGILGGGGAPHSPEVREALREELGLNDPLAVQYGKWLWSMASGEFGGQSLVTGRPIRSLVARELPVTLLLALYAVLLSVLVSVPLGVLAAWRWKRWPDYVVRLATIAGQAVPSFWLALLLILGLVLVFHWSPPIVYTHPWEDPWNHLQIVIWPVLLLSWEYSSYIARVTRASMLDVLQESYVTTARAKGLPERAVVLGHVLRNALPPIITVMGFQLGALLGGTLILESIFGLPGIGRGLVTAALARDYPVVQSMATLLVFAMLSVSLIIDLVYTVADPRISYSTRTAT